MSDIAGAEARPDTSSAVPASRPASGTGPDWTVQVADRIESVVGTVRDKTTVPVTKVARAVVFGLLAAVMGTVAAVMAIIEVVRLHVYLPLHPESRQVWVFYAGLGLLFVLGGAFCWGRRSSRGDR